MAKGIDKKVKNEMSNNSVSTILDENTQEALDLLFAKDQQTYDEFLDSFLYLPKGWFVLKFQIVQHYNPPCFGHTSTGGY